MGSIIEIVRPILFAFIGDCRTKRLICDLLDKYVKTTDNNVDDSLALAVRVALLRDCP